MHTSKLFAVIVFVLLGLSASSFSASRQGDLSTNGREVFQLELPDLPPVTDFETTIESADIKQFTLRMFKPYAAKVETLQLRVRVNGVAAGPAASVLTQRGDYLIRVDLTKGFLKLRADKNVIEAYILKGDQSSYYVSYVLLVGRRVLRRDNEIKITTNSQTATSGDDRQSPSVYLADASNMSEAIKKKTPLTISGLVADNSGASDVTVLINGRSVKLSPLARDVVKTPLTNAKAGEPTAPMEFSATVQPPFGDQILIEARDKAGNSTRVDVNLHPAAATAKIREFSGNKYAIVIGISKYKYSQSEGIVNLDYADRDAASIRDWLKNGGFDEENNILYLANEKATLDAVRGALKIFLPKIKSTDLLVFFLAGHGGPDPYDQRKLYFWMHDTRVSDVKNTGLAMDELWDIFRKYSPPERLITFIDTCHSGGLISPNEKKTPKTDNRQANVYAEKLFSEKGRAVLTAAGAGQSSLEDSRWGGGHGVFTWCLIEGLRGAADDNKDGYVTAGELFKYVESKVNAQTESRQKPVSSPGTNTEMTLSKVSK